MKNKIILVTLIFFVIFSFCSFSFAFSFKDELRDFSFNNDDVICPENSYILVYYNSNSNSYSYICASKEFHINVKCETDYYYEYVLYKNQTFWQAIKDNNPRAFTLSDTIKNKVVYTNYDLKDENGFVIFHKPIQNAFIQNKESIQSGKFDKVVVNAADYTNKELYLLTYWFTENTDNSFETMLPRKIILLKILNNFYVGTKNEKAIYEVPFGYTGIDLVER